MRILHFVNLRQHDMQLENPRVKRPHFSRTYSCGLPNRQCRTLQCCFKKCKGDVKCNLQSTTLRRASQIMEVSFYSTRPGKLQSCAVPIIKAERQDKTAVMNSAEGGATSEPETSTGERTSLRQKKNSRPSFPKEGRDWALMVAEAGQDRQ